MRVQLDTVAFSFAQTNPYCTFEFHTSLELSKNPEFLCDFEVSQSLNWGYHGKVHLVSKMQGKIYFFHALSTLFFWWAKISSLNLHRPALLVEAIATELLAKFIFCSSSLWSLQYHHCTTKFGWIGVAPLCLGHQSILSPCLLLRSSGFMEICMLNMVDQRTRSIKLDSVLI